MIFYHQPLCRFSQSPASIFDKFLGKSAIRLPAPVVGQVFASKSATHYNHLMTIHRAGERIKKTVSSWDGIEAHPPVPTILSNCAKTISKT